MTRAHDIQPLEATDVSFLWRILCCAAHMEGPDEVEVAQATPGLSRYVLGFGREGDFGFKAFVDDVPVAAAFCRSWSPDDAGYGFVDEQTPELAIACLPGYEGQGLGSSVLGAVVEHGDAHGLALSLSVREQNPAIRLYERFGFTAVPGTRIANRVGTMSYVMRRAPRAR